jgi:hypothetical protein
LGTSAASLIYLKRFGAGACGGHDFNEQIFDANEQVSRTATTPLEKRSALCLAERERPNSTLNLLCFNLPRPARIPVWSGLFPSMAATNKALAQMSKSQDVGQATKK